MSTSARAARGPAAAFRRVMAIEHSTNGIRSHSRDNRYCRDAVGAEHTITAFRHAGIVLRPLLLLLLQERSPQRTGGSLRLRHTEGISTTPTNRQAPAKPLERDCEQSPNS